MGRPLEVELQPSETQEAFMRSTVLENMIVSPRGEGKTDVCIMSMTHHAGFLQDKKFRPIPWAIVRDTWKNLERTTLRSFLYPRPGSFPAMIRPKLRIRDGGRFIELPGLWTAFLFGVDTPDDIDQLQSMQLGGLWIEEAAPAMQEEIGKGIAEEVWTIGITSLSHQLMSVSASEFLREMGGPLSVPKWSPKELKEGLLLGCLVRSDDGTIVVRNRRAQISENYPSEDHWTWVRFYENPSPDRALFRIPREENTHIDSQYRDNMAAALVGRQDLLDRLVEGRPAHVQMGESVTPDYRESINGIPWHRSKSVLVPNPNLTVYRFWDGDLNPSVHFAQVTPRGRFVGLSTLRAAGIGMKQFITNIVKPHIAEKYYNCTKWRDLGDPTLADRDPSDSTLNAKKVLEEELGTHYEGGLSNLKGLFGRLEAMRDLLTQTIDGESKNVLSKDDKIMHRALNGGWHFRKKPNGEIDRSEPVNDSNSHPASGLSHGIALIYKYQKENRIVLPPPKKNLAISSSVQPLYASGR